MKIFKFQCALAVRFDQGADGFGKSSCLELSSYNNDADEMIFHACRPNFSNRII